MVNIINGQVVLDGRNIGKLNEREALVMRRSVERHKYRVLEAWCLNVEVVNCGAKRFIIDTTDTAERYVVTLDAIMRLRSVLNLFVTFGKERQLAVPLMCWDKYHHGNLSFPAQIGLQPADFADSCTGRWRSRLIARSQMEIQL